MSKFEWFLHLQQSHVAISKNDLVTAKKEALLACSAINEALKTLSAPTKTEADAFRQYGEAVINHYKIVSSNGQNALSAKEKIDWLTSRINGFSWYPVMQLGDRTSFDIPPISAASQSDEKIGLPNLGPDYSIDLRYEADHTQDVSTSFGKLQLESQDSCTEKQTHLLDLYQDLLSDCSFVSALISIDHLGLSSELCSAISGLEASSSFVKVKLLIHGIYREIVVSKKLPYVTSKHSEERSLFVRSTSDADLLWPALLEKAFLTTSEGQYDLLGSNMANDTYMLIGWLPEIRMVSKTNFEDIVDLCKFRESGMVSLGLGTGAISPELSKNLGLVAQHDYVLKGFDSATGTFTVTNPWKTSKDGISSNPDGDYRNLQLDYSLLSQFNYLYLNWRPDYKNRYQSCFVCATSTWPSKYLADKPQFSFSNPSSEPQSIAILVEQFMNSRRDFCVSVWSGAKNKIVCTSQYLCIAGGKFTNSRLQLLKLTMEPLKSYIVSISPRSFPEDKKTSSYSLSVYHNLGSSFILEKSVFELSKCIPQVVGDWSIGSMGGNWSYETFLTNPQFDVEVFEGTKKINFILGCNNDQTNVNLHLFHSEKENKGQRIRNFDKSKLLFNSNYSRQLQYVELDVISAGSYKLVLSTFDPNVSASYKLLIGNDGHVPVDIQAIPESLGLFMKKDTFHWENTNREKFKLSTKYPQNKILFQVFSGGGVNPNDYRPAIRASVFDGFTRKPVVTISQWNDCVHGIYLECVLEFADRDYILLVERFERGTGAFRINIGSSHRLEFSRYNE